MKSGAKSGPAKPADRPWLFAAIVALYALSIPWWHPHGLRPSVVLGLPSWVAASLFYTLAIAALTAFAALRLWSDGPDEASTSNDMAGPDRVPREAPPPAGPAADA